MLISFHTVTTHYFIFEKCKKILHIKMHFPERSHVFSYVPQTCKDYPKYTNTYTYLLIFNQQTISHFIVSKIIFHTIQPNFFQILVSVFDSNLVCMFVVIFYVRTIMSRYIQNEKKENKKSESWQRQLKLYCLEKIILFRVQNQIKSPLTRLSKYAFFPFPRSNDYYYRMPHSRSFFRLSTNVLAFLNTSAIVFIPMFHEAILWSSCNTSYLLFYGNERSFDVGDTWN